MIRSVGVPGSSSNATQMPHKSKSGNDGSSVFQLGLDITGDIAEGSSLRSWKPGSYMKFYEVHMVLAQSQVVFGRLLADRLLQEWWLEICRPQGVLRLSGTWSAARSLGLGPHLPPLLRPTVNMPRLDQLLDTKPRCSNNRRVLCCGNIPEWPPCWRTTRP